MKWLAVLASLVLPHALDLHLIILGFATNLIGLAVLAWLCYLRAADPVINLWEPPPLSVTIMTGVRRICFSCWNLSIICLYGIDEDQVLSKSRSI